MTSSAPPGHPAFRSRTTLPRTDRSFVAFLLLLGAATILLAGCGESPAVRSTAAAPAAPAPLEPHAPVRLVLLAMEDFIDAGILRQFEKETGIGIDHVVYGEADEISPRLRSQPGSADMVIVDSFTIKTLRELRLLCPLRKDTLGNLGHIDPRHQGLAFDPTNDYCIPYHWGTTLIAYRRDLVPEPERSWRLLWNPILKGRVMMLKDSFEPMAVTMILNGIDPQTADRASYARASDILIEHLEIMDARYGSDDEVKDALVDGSVAAAMCYSGDAAVAAGQNPNVDFFIPEEGGTIWVDCLAICRDTQNAAMAHRFLDFFLRPEIAARNAEAINYAPANKTAESLVSPSLKNDPRVYPPAELRDKLRHVPTLDEKRESLSRRYWHRIRSHWIARDETTGAKGVERTSRTTP